MFVVSLLYACGFLDGRAVSLALALAYDRPDSALHILAGVDQYSLSDKDMALYSMAYTTAQDRQGVDVASDSLLRTAYYWYDRHPKDSLYARCEYYMGRFYMLNDSTEKAVGCLEKAWRAASKGKDTVLVCLALEKLSKVTAAYDRHKALGYARRVYELYDSVGGATTSNKVYSRLNYCECLRDAGKVAEAVALGNEALRMAKAGGDSTAVSDCLVDLCGFYGRSGDDAAALECIKAARSFNRRKVNEPLLLNLAIQYVEADSLAQAKALLEGARLTRMPQRRMAFAILAEIARKEGDAGAFKSYSDSANSLQEQMQDEAVRGKVEYYQTALKREGEKAEMKGRAARRQAALLIIAIAVACVAVAVGYAYVEARRRRRVEIELSERLHREELAHKDVQLSVMRNYLVKRVDVMSKLNEVKEHPQQRILLSEDDWGELEAFLNANDDMFVDRLRKNFPKLRESDIQLMMLLRIKMPQKALSEIYCISEKAVKQKLFLYKEKVGIKGERTSLREFVEAF